MDPVGQEKDKLIPQVPAAAVGQLVEEDEGELLPGIVRLRKEDDGAEDPQGHGAGGLPADPEAGDPAEAQLPGPLPEELQKLHQCAVSSACSFVQPACLAALELDPAPARERYRRQRELAAARLSAMGLSFPPAEGGFYLFPRISPFGLSSEEFCLRLIREAGVGLVPGSCFGCEGYVRLSCAPGEETLSLALDRLEGFLRRLGRASP